MTWTVLTSSLLPLLTKLSLHTPLRLASRLTDTSAAGITASSSRETRRPGCVSASPRLKSLHKCDLYWLIYETACPLLSLCARSCACCRAGVSNTNLLLVAWQTEGSSGSGPARQQSFCPSIQLSHPPMPPPEMHLITFTGWTEVIFSRPDPSKSHYVNYCWHFFEQLACVSSHKVGQKLLRCSIQMSWCFILAGFLKHCFKEHLGQGIACHICYNI